MEQEQDYIWHHQFSYPKTIWKKEKTAIGKAIIRNTPSALVKKDRHSADYYKKYRERKKLEKEATSSSTDVSSASSSSDTSSISNTETEKKAKSKKKDRRAYYREYNRKHPERLNRGFIKWYVNGNVSDGAINQSYGIRVLGYDELGRPITNDPFGDILRNKEMEWHDDDWCEEPD